MGIALGAESDRVERWSKALVSGILPSRPLGRKVAVAGIVVIIASVLVTYHSSIRIGFFGDDWWEVANAGRKSLPDFLRFYFDPFSQTIWYRPMHGVLLLLEYALFRSNADGYHVGQMLIHLVNSLLLGMIIAQVTGLWRTAFVSALLYSAIFPGGLAVNTIAVHDPLATLFYLLTILLWVAFLRTKSRPYYLLAVISFVSALLSKETNATLIVTLLLLDRFFVAPGANFRDLLKRYSSLGICLFIYLAIEYRIQLSGHFSNRAGYSLGFHVVENAWHYLELLVWPWSWDQMAAFVWLLIMVLLLGAIVLPKPRWGLKASIIFFLAVQFFLGVAPVLGFPDSLFDPRYLYSASTVSVVIIALLFERLWSRLAWQRFFASIVAIAAAVLTVLYSSSVSESAMGMAELNRQLRVPFRDIVQQHPTFPPDTLLYFINPPELLKHAAPSMFFFRYGSDVSVWSVAPQWWGTIDEERMAGLRDHKSAYVYYYDANKQRHEIAVDPSASPTSIPRLPLSYTVPIQLEGYEVTSTKIKRGEPLVLLLYWRATEVIEKDYTVFVHLVDRDGQIVAGQDNQPLNGAAPTHTWQKGKLVVDPYVLPITFDLAPQEDYRLEVGLYFLPTMERVRMIDTTSTMASDALVIWPISVLD